MDADSIREMLVNFIHENGLEMRRVIAFCSDGASVMTGCHNGVGVQLQQTNPFMQCVHCIAHRLALCCADCADDMDYPDMAENVINNISAFFNHSGKRTNELQKISRQFNIGRTKIVKSGKTRWLSRAAVVDVLLQMFAALSQLFMSNAQADDTAAALSKAFTTYMFVGILCGMADLLALLAELSRSYQKDTIDYSTMQTRLLQVRSAVITDFLSQANAGDSSFDPNLSHDDWNSLWNRTLNDGADFIKEPTGENISEFLASGETYQGVELQSGLDGSKVDLPRERKELLVWLTKFAVAIMSRLAERFPIEDMKIFKALEVLNPEKMPADSAELGPYGDDDVQTLCDHYGKPKTVDGVVHPAYVDPKKLKVEWRLFKRTLHSHRAGATWLAAACKWADNHCCCCGAQRCCSIGHQMGSLGSLFKLW